VPGVGPFSNANVFALDLSKTKTDLKFSFSSHLNPIFHMIIRHPNKKLFEIGSIPGSKSGVSGLRKYLRQFFFEKSLIKFMIKNFKD
jgi:hypothetical protein